MCLRSASCNVLSNFYTIKRQIFLFCFNALHFLLSMEYVVSYLIQDFGVFWVDFSTSQFYCKESQINSLAILFF